MQYITLDTETDFDGWRKAARSLVLHHVQPTDVTWTVQGGEAELFAPPSPSPIFEVNDGTFNVSAKFVELAKAAILHRDPERFAILYRLLWRLKDNHDLIEVATDPDVAQVTAMARAVHRDEHKMHAFVRFREIGRERAAHYVAWFEPEHYIVELAAPFFAKRFAALVDPDTRSVCALGWPRALVHVGREQERSTRRRPARGNLAALLRQHLQSGAAESEGNADGDAEEILEEPARGVDH